MSGQLTSIPLVAVDHTIYDKPAYIVWEHRRISVAKINEEQPYRQQATYVAPRTEPYLAGAPNDISKVRNHTQLKEY